MSVELQQEHYVRLRKSGLFPKVYFLSLFPGFTFNLYFPTSIFIFYFLSYTFINCFHIYTFTIYFTSYIFLIYFPAILSSSIFPTSTFIHFTSPNDLIYECIIQASLTLLEEKLEALHGKSKILAFFVRFIVGQTYNNDKNTMIIFLQVYSPWFT